MTLIFANGQQTVYLRVSETVLAADEYIEVIGQIFVPVVTVAGT